MGALSRYSCVDIYDRLPQYPYKHDMATANAARKCINALREKFGNRIGGTNYL